MHSGGLSQKKAALSSYLSYFMQKKYDLFVAEILILGNIFISRNIDKNSGIFYFTSCTRSVSDTKIQDIRQ
jgi:hypothetical protein